MTMVESAPEIGFPADQKVSVRSSLFVKGQLGVITKREYTKGETIFSVEGPILSRPTKYSFAVGLGKHIEPVRQDGIVDFGHYLNHSCEPNVITRPVDDAMPLRIDVIARHDIRNGEELAFDYASLEYDITVTNSPCQCGAKSCRNIIHGFKDIPADIKGRYVEEGIVASYLLEIDEFTSDG